VNRSKLAPTILLSVVFSLHVGASSVKSPNGLASASLVRISRAMRFKLDHKGLLVIALEDCSVVINGHRDALKAGDYKEFRTGDSVELSPAASTNPQLVLVDVLEASQPLTILPGNLAVHQELEDASDRNQTLLIALDILQISYEQNLAVEGEPWKSSHTRTVRLHRGETAWLEKGMHRMRNTGNTAARFITIEW